MSRPLSHGDGDVSRSVRRQQKGRSCIMKYQQRIITSLVAITASLLGLVTIPIQAAEPPHSAHQAADAPRTSATNAPPANPFAKEARVDAETQSTPGIVGKDWSEPVEDSQVNHLALFDLLEYRAYSAGSPTMTWDFVGWLGGDYNRLWMKTEGDQNLSRGNGVQGDVQLLYGRLIAPFWDLQAGVRYNGITGPNRNADSRTYAVIGLQGLAKQRFDVEPTLYISDRGEVSAELTVSIDYFLTQRLVLQPRFEAQASIQGDRKFDTASGVNQTDIGLRLRYEIWREFAPYIGVTWLQKYGGTASIARSQREPKGAVAFVAGVRLSF
ncbi:MAG: copper resistance protein B [Limisphaerales bacterium]